MKRKDVKIGGYVVHKKLGSIVKAIEEMTVAGALASGEPSPIGGVIIRSSAPCMVGHNLKHGIIPKLYRKPRISDLKVGDVFEWAFSDNEIVKHQVTGHGSNLINGKRYAELETQNLTNGGKAYFQDQVVSHKTKIRIISLASEKPVKKLGDVLDDVSHGIDPTPEWAKKTASDKLQAEMAAIKTEIEQPEPERKVLKRWVNIYSDRACFRADWYEANRLAGKDRIACVEIEIPYYEGEGL